MKSSWRSIKELNDSIVEWDCLYYLLTRKIYGYTFPFWGWSWVSIISIKNLGRYMWTKNYLNSGLVCYFMVLNDSLAWWSYVVLYYAMQYCICIIASFYNADILNPYRVNFSPYVLKIFTLMRQFFHHQKIENLLKEGMNCLGNFFLFILS